MTADYHDYLINSLKNSEEMAAYLKAVLDGGSYEELRKAVENVIEALVDKKPRLGEDSI